MSHLNKLTPYNNIKSKVFNLILFLMLLPAPLAAQSTPGLPGDGDPGQAPIDDWALPLLMGGIILVFLYLNKQKTSSFK